MLNKLIEQSRHKCARYWPEKLNEPMLVTHAESDKLYFTVTLEGISINLALPSISSLTSQMFDIAVISSVYYYHK